VDGVTARREGLRGKPHPDTFLTAAERLEVHPKQAAVFEDALAGVEAGRAGEFGWVVGVDRVGQGGAMKRRGADMVVRDLADLLSPDPQKAELDGASDDS
jgi:beta-phosphoglucomutase-like phosphatase (HAD superfamily)